LSDWVKIFAPEGRLNLKLYFVFSYRRPVVDPCVDVGVGVAVPVGVGVADGSPVPVAVGVAVEVADGIPVLVAVPVAVGVVATGVVGVVGVVGTAVDGDAPAR
jgi:hypothetical protein